MVVVLFPQAKQLRDAHFSVRLTERDEEVEGQTPPTLLGKRERA